MHIHVLASASSAQEHLRRVLPERAAVTFGVHVSSVATADDIVLIHAQSFASDLDHVLRALADSSCVLGVVSDKPNLNEFLRLTQFGVNAYANSHMGSQHYEQMLDMINSGQHWYPPELVRQALSFAREAQHQPPEPDLLTELTARERDVALDVATGLSNRAISQQRRISEATVKTHLGRIFQKLNVKGRLELAVLLRSNAPADRQSLSA